MRSLAGELPVGLKKVAFCWERGTKAFHTSAEPVNPHTRAVFWTQFLRQVGMRRCVVGVVLGWAEGMRAR